MSEIYGPEGGAKTTIALSTSRGVLERGGTVLYLDLEKGLDGGVTLPEGHIKGWMEINGVDPNNENFVVVRPMTGEEAYTMIEQAIKNELFDLIVLDSMGALIPRSDLDGNIGESAYGKVAKLNAEALKRVLASYESQKVDKTHLMVINQARDNMSGYGGVKSTGGRALSHFVSTKIRCVRTGKEAEVGVNIITVRTDKNRFSMPWEESTLYVHPRCGIDATLELIELGVEDGVVTKGGAWYTFHDPMTGEEIFKEQGKAKAIEVLEGEQLEYRNQLKEVLYQKGLAKLIALTGV